MAEIISLQADNINRQLYDAKMAIDAVIKSYKAGKVDVLNVNYVVDVLFMESIRIAEKLGAEPLAEFEGGILSFCNWHRHVEKDEAALFMYLDSVIMLRLTFADISHNDWGKIYSVSQAFTILAKQHYPEHLEKDAKLSPDAVINI